MIKAQTGLQPLLAREALEIDSRAALADMLMVTSIIESLNRIDAIWKPRRFRRMRKLGDMFKP